MQDPFGPRELVATHPSYRDPAIDMSDPDEMPEGALTAAQRIERYRETLDLSHLRFKSGQKPTLFVCKPIAAAFLMKVLRGQSHADASRNAFVVSCHEVRVAGGPPKTVPKFDHQLVYGQRIPENEDAWLDTLVRVTGADNIEDMGALLYRYWRLPEALRAPLGSPPGST